jgi:hypothetical protein
MMDVYRDIYVSQRQFVLRDKRPSFVFNETKFSTLIEAVFGSFPKEENAQEFYKAYSRVFEPNAVDPEPDHWFEVFQHQATVPFTPTYHKIEVLPRGGRDLSFFIFDHSKPADLIDYWNKRLFESPVYPVPICWIEALAPTIVGMITDNHRPIPNNQFGTMFHSTLYFGRSLGSDKIKCLIDDHFSPCPEDSYFIGAVWHPEVRSGSRGPISERHRLTAGSARIDTPLVDGNSLRLDTLSPDFASRYSLGHFRWANVINLDCYESDAFALCLPTNLEDRSTPRLFVSLLERPVISREGWSLGQEHKASKEFLELSDGATAIVEWLGRRGIRAKPSSAGRIARQMIDALGSLWGARLISDQETLRLLNGMATQEELKGSDETATKRLYEGRTAPFHVWNALVRRRRKDQIRNLSLEDFTNRGVLRLGLSVDCPNCTYTNWYGLDVVDYRVTCDRCQKQFGFPQGNATRSWKFRVIGSFSVPNFAEGAYAVALALNMFNQKMSGSADVEMTYATGLELETDTFKREIDFALWLGRRAVLGQRAEPRLIIGEAKSFADEAISERDIENLKLVAAALPGVTIVVSVLKNSFSDSEKALLRDFTKWGWEHVKGGMRAQIILLTGLELFADFRVGTAWKQAGEPFARFDDYHVFNDLDEFARATQIAYLGLDYFEELKSRATKKIARDV